MIINVNELWMIVDAGRAVLVEDDEPKMLIEALKTELTQVPLMHISVPEGDYESFLSGLASVLMHEATTSFSNRFDGLAVLDAGRLDGEPLLALLELLQKLSSRVMVIGSKGSAGILAGALLKVNLIPALWTPELEMCDWAETLSRCATKAGITFANKRVLAQAVNAAKAATGVEAFSPTALIYALMPCSGCEIRQEDLDREHAPGGYIALCEALMKERPVRRNAGKRRMGFYTDKDEESERMKHVA